MELLAPSRTPGADITESPNGGATRGVIRTSTHNTGTQCIQDGALTFSLGVITLNLSSHHSPFAIHLHYARRCHTGSLAEASGTPTQMRDRVKRGVKLSGPEEAGRLCGIRGAAGGNVTQGTLWLS
ncbi:hypothetical protein SKAU_G00347050 [Synaphobranchus kaupii]|uniref:Uncharacterized protein n=1 Tax=Synaphobranchus kaupii TaxID=118154 RepID=A0A9Q1EJR0_SYNKA|nr:hypothetical protein SKAU_G00347050 [Synaphobranchus kaupii]